MLSAARLRVRGPSRWAKREGERDPGAQPGHKGSGRKLLPEERLDEIVDHHPEACAGCGHEFSEEERESQGRFGRHQAAELPPIAVIYREHRTYRLRCSCCGKRTTAELPPGVSDSPFGPGLQAALVTLTARNRVSRRDMSELAADLFGLGLSVGAVDAICQRDPNEHRANHQIPRHRHIAKRPRSPPPCRPERIERERPSGVQRVVHRD